MRLFQQYIMRILERYNYSVDPAAVEELVYRGLPTLNRAALEERLQERLHMPARLDLEILEAAKSLRDAEIISSPLRREVG